MDLVLNEKYVTVNNRYFLEIEHVNDEKRFVEDTCTYFVLSQSGVLNSHSVGGRGTFGAQIQTGVVTGPAVVITFRGLQRSGESITTINPTTPGDLSYIDGCSNSVVISAARNGDPCLNYLYFPPGIDQTFHTHPSVRVGLIVDGNGQADYYDETGKLTQTKLNTGDWFVLDRHVKHRFSTSSSHMSILVFHPDSEDGPRDEHNPMKSRTYCYD
jgi:hypothetical protein